MLLPSLCFVYYFELTAMVVFRLLRTRKKSRKSTWLLFGKTPNAWYAQPSLFIMGYSDLIRLQYVKQETLSNGENGKEARATRLITERASRRIGKMAFETALTRERKVQPSHPSSPRSSVILEISTLYIVGHHHPQIQCPLRHRRSLPRDGSRGPNSA